nr:MAG TPA: hypothetical protein [Caudoviricetes sp.]
MSKVCLPKNQIINPTTVEQSPVVFLCPEGGDSL